jgi:CheY-like chemotaxis protein
MTQDSVKTRKPELKVPTLQHRTATFPARQRVLLIEDDANMRRMLSAFLTSMQCECVTTTRREALTFLPRKEFDAVLIDFGFSSISAQRFFPKMQKLHPYVMGKTLAITRGGADTEATKVVEDYALPHIPENRLIQELWSSLQPLFSSPGRQQLGSVPGQGASLVFDSFCRQSPSRTPAGAKTARHLMYKCDGLFVDLLIGPLPKAGRVEIIGQVVANSSGKINLANLQVVLVKSSGPLSYARTNRLGEFRMESGTDDDLAVKIPRGPNSWIETRLRNMDWARKPVAGLRDK